ncbi:hypothetical protein [Promicromonospora panici]|uniref:hypothetical protein n=1 Tax=Promicromonospora panici TaxID=2219658 RepID=UPI00101DBC73|nr:hypothetical protein [Promicromonospora panici]
MTAPVGNLVAGIIVLDGLWTIEALSVDLHSGWIFPEGYSPSIPVVEVTVHAEDFAGAERVAARLDLTPEEQAVVPGSPRKLRRYWSGWVTSAPGESLVWARVLAFEDLADHPTPTGPGARDGWESVPLFGDGSDTDDESADEPVKASA